MMPRNAYCGLTAYRIRKGLTLRQMSELCGLSPATLCRLERCTFRPSARSRVLLQDRLGLSSEHIEQLLRPPASFADKESLRSA